MIFGKKTEVQLARERLLKNRQWLDKNIKDLQKDYAERWIVVVDEHVAASGGTPDEARKAIKGSYSKEEIMLMRIPSGEIMSPI